MIPRRTLLFCIVCLLTCVACTKQNSETQTASANEAQPAAVAETPKAHAGRTSGLVNTCLTTSNVRRLAEFYEPVLGLKAKWSGEDYAEFHTGVGVLAIFSFAAQEKYIPNATEPGKNRSAILEFRVSDVDQEYARLQSLVRIWVKPPTTQPWGTRSVYFRDPDGNLVDFYSSPKAQ
jgi:catechol 2,3-dioxygenase-like lactoylglutathione lyase family enzyme